MTITLPSAGGSLKRLAQLAPFVGIHHLRVGDHPSEPRPEIGPSIPVLRRETFVLHRPELLHIELRAELSRPFVFAR